ncbi:allatostatins MIP [Eupeodes corollae]|uniref:allatostatins MIP n=1 Tax=Eupeodes corollae TaxID=290404 RepID=UPI00248F8AF9|nr:allatostatins MIP [Eupeodes corollae]
MMVNQTRQTKKIKKTTKLSSMSHYMNLLLVKLLVMAFLSANLGAAAYAESKEFFEDESPLEDVDKYLNDPSTSNTMEKLKRSWKSLQGSWGKRNDEGSIAEYYDSEQPEWNLIKPSENSNENDSEASDSEPKALKYYVMYASSPNVLATTVGAAAASTNNLKDLAAMDSSDSNFEKKSWKNMNVAWGKRRSAVWNKFRGAWGKREPAWNNLKGMWGKRSPKDWKKLQSAWGKRSQRQNRK